MADNQQLQNVSGKIEVLDNLVPVSYTTSQQLAFLQGYLKECAVKFTVIKAGDNKGILLVPRGVIPKLLRLLDVQSKSGS